MSCFADNFLPLWSLSRKSSTPFDVVLVIGSTVFNYYPHIPGEIVKQGTKVLQLTNDPQVAARALTGTSVIGNILLAVEQLLQLVEQRDMPRDSSRPPQKLESHSDPSHFKIRPATNC